MQTVDTTGAGTMRRTNEHHRRFGVAAALVGLTLVVFAPAASGGSAFAFPPLTLSATAGPPGSTFTVSGTGCTAGLFPPALGPDPGQPVSVTVGFVPTPVTSTTLAADDTGAWSITFTVPADAQPGLVTVTATCSLGVLESDMTGATASVVAFQTPSIAYPAATFTVTAVAAAPIPAAPRTTG